MYSVYCSITSSSQEDPIVCTLSGYKDDRDKAASTISSLSQWNGRADEEVKEGEEGDVGG